MLKQRVVTALILGALVLLGIFFLPVAAWGIAVGLVLVLAAREWSTLLAIPSLGGWILTAFSPVLPVLAGFFPLSDQIAMAVYGLGILFWGLVVSASLFLKPRFAGLGAVFSMAMGLVVFMPASLALVELKRAEPRLLVLAILGVSMADIAAYFVGRRFGKRKLAPNISPGKSWEGFFGGLAGVVFFSLACAFGFLPTLVASVGLPVIAVFSIVYALASVEGDLFESLLKRQAGLKDSGSLLPGHGGVLDRVDSMLSTLPLAGMALLLWQIFR